MKYFHLFFLHKSFFTRLINAISHIHYSPVFCRNISQDFKALVKSEGETNVVDENDKFFFWAFEHDVNGIRRILTKTSESSSGINLYGSFGTHTHGNVGNGIYGSVWNDGEYVKILTIFNDVRVEVFLSTSVPKKSETANGIVGWVRGFISSGPTPPTAKYVETKFHTKPDKDFDLIKFLEKTVSNSGLAEAAGAIITSLDIARIASGKEPSCESLWANAEGLLQKTRLQTDLRKSIPNSPEILTAIIYAKQSEWIKMFSSADNPQPAITSTGLVSPVHSEGLVNIIAWQGHDGAMKRKLTGFGLDDSVTIFRTNIGDVIGSEGVNVVFVGSETPEAEQESIFRVIASGNGKCWRLEGSMKYVADQPGQKVRKVFVTVLIAERGIAATMACGKWGKDRIDVSKSFTSNCSNYPEPCEGYAGVATKIISDISKNGSKIPIGKGSPVMAILMSSGQLKEPPQSLNTLKKK